MSCSGRGAAGAAGLLAVAIASPALAEPPATPDAAGVQFTVEPYVWAPTVDGTVSLGPLSLPVHVTPRDLVSGFRLGAMGRLAVSKGPASLAVEGIGVDFQRDRFAPLLGQDVAVRVLALEVTGGYRLGSPAKTSITPLLGLRYNSIDARFGTAPAVLPAKGKWLEPAAGALVSTHPLPRLELSGKILAGYRDRRRHSVDVRGEVAYSLRRHTQVFAGYRYLKQEFASRNGGLAINLGGDGPLLGLRQRF